LAGAVLGVALATDGAVGCAGLNVRYKFITIINFYAFEQVFILLNNFNSGAVDDGCLLTVPSAGIYFTIGFGFIEEVQAVNRADEFSLSIFLWGFDVGIAILPDSAGVECAKDIRNYFLFPDS
jgi:hypothetical protein